MTRKEKQDLIWKAYMHNDEARRMASCNALYMGSMGLCILISDLGMHWPDDSLEEAIENASDEQLDTALANPSVQNLLKYAKPHVPLQFRLLSDAAMAGLKVGPLN